MQISVSEVQTTLSTTNVEHVTDQFRMGLSEVDLAGVREGNKVVLAIAYDAPTQLKSEIIAVQSLQRYLTFMSKREVLSLSTMPILQRRSDETRSLSIRIDPGVSVEHVLATARHAVAEGRSGTLVCIAARPQGATDLADVITVLREASVPAIWLYDSSERILGNASVMRADFDWTYTLHRKCGSTLSGIFASSNFESSLRACSHFAHSLWRRL